jgi:hypothetical protein
LINGSCEPFHILHSVCDAYQHDTAKLCSSAKNGQQWLGALAQAEVAIVADSASNVQSALHFSHWGKAFGTKVVWVMARGAVLLVILKFIKQIHRGSKG